MIGDSLPEDSQNNIPTRFNKQGRSIQQAQEVIYNFLLEIVKKWPPEEVLLEFKRLFIFHVESISSTAIHAIYEIVFSNNEEEFRHTLKRCCYILVNNWDASRHYKPIQELIQSFSDPTINRYTISPTLKRLRIWIENFKRSKDFEELKLFASRYEDKENGPWSSRYTSYLLVPQYIDLKNPIEQREAARTLSKQLKDRFKFDLAMYIARSQSAASSHDRIPKNPTALGDEVLRLIKMIVAKRGPFSYGNLANIFLNQVRQLSYAEFKQSLKSYLIFSVENQEFADTLQSRLAEKLSTLYEVHDHDPIDNALILRTCNRAIEYLTTEDHQNPSPLFVLLLSQGNPLTLVIVLLKLILISKHSRTHLEARIADLIRYYEKCPEEECWWVVHFLEIFNITFAIYAENVQYNLIRMEEEATQAPQPSQPSPMGEYRIFSQLRLDAKADIAPDVVLEESLVAELEATQADNPAEG